MRKIMVSLPVAAGVAAGTLLLGLAAGVSAQGRAQLVVFKNSVPTDVRKWNGKLYVPIADVAKVMQWRLTVQGGNISLQPPSPSTVATPTPTKKEGAVLEELRTGQQRFQVLKIAEADRYEPRYANGLVSKTPLTADDKEKLVMVYCVLTNATTARDEFVFSREHWGENTQLIDRTGESVTPLAYDVAADEINPTGAYAQSGANVQFAVVFRVPKSFQPKAFLFTIVRYGERGMHKGTDVRVNLP